MSRTVPFETCDRRLRRVYDYWQGKRGARAMPGRADVDPGELRSVLPYLMLTDVLDGGHRFRYRLFGTAVAEAFGMDPTGRFVDEVMSDPKYRAFIVGLYRDIVTMKRPIYSTTRYGGHRDVEMWTQRLMMPLSSDGEGCSRPAAVADRAGRRSNATPARPASPSGSIWTAQASPASRPASASSTTCWSSCRATA